MRRMLPYFLGQAPDWPHTMEHRKHWELAQVYLGLEQLGALRPDAFVLAVGAGHEEIAFDLTNVVRWVFATDIYGTGHFASREAQGGMLFDPDSWARCPHNRRRLVVQHMDALDLRFEDATFDAVYSVSSIEHFGDTEGAARSLAEQARVTKPGGVVAFVTEVVVNGAPGFSEGHLTLFTPEQVLDLADSVPGLRPVEPIDFCTTPGALDHVTTLADALADANAGVARYPEIVLEHEGRQFTSVAVFLRRDSL